MTASADDSSRFVLAATGGGGEAPFLGNLAALWAVDATLAAEIEAIDDEQVYPVVASRSGPPTLSLPTGDGKSLWLHSRYEPVREAAGLVDPIDIADTPAFYVLGFGLGYHVQALADRVSAKTMLVIFEPDLRLLRTAFTHIDFSRLISSRLFFFCKADKAELFRLLTPHWAVLSVGFTPVVHGPSLQLHAEFFRQIKTWIGEFASYSRTTMNTLVLNSTRTAQNIAANIARYAASPSLARLKDRFAKYPAVIISAGPSLRKNKHLLKGLSDRAVLIAVQTTLQPMLEMGVRPHFVTSLDYHEICARFFEKLPGDLRTELVAEPKATPRIFELNPGPLTIVGNDFAEGLLRELSLSKPTLPAGATVAHLAYFLAEYLACDPIIFVGQDLAFSDGLCYMPGTSYEDVWRPEMSPYCTVEMKQWEQIIRDRYILRKLTDQQGRGIYTEERLFTYLQQFERDFGRSKATIVDATEGGAIKRGTRPMTLAAAIEKFCAQSLPKIQQDHPGIDESVAEKCLPSLEARREEGRRIEEISRQTLPLLQEIRDHLDDQNRVNRVIGKIDSLRAKMDELGRTYDMVTQLTQQSEVKRFEHDWRLAASGVTGIDRQRRQVMRDIDNVSAVIDAAVQFQKLMDETIHGLAGASCAK
ncbi:MAG TPA: 6-hydroxymethylpterin diphosphokinase MptE-like protein [Tepidisphaeraceae bacterium]|nr:6-hydroxymethylpterin diphosphokinase MptE-like protein [Tepidisphaeraceae bacterium]